MGWVDAPDEWVVGWRWAANNEEAAWGALGNVDGDDDHKGGVEGAWEANQQSGSLTSKKAQHVHDAEPC